MAQLLHLGQDSKATHDNLQQRLQIKYDYIAICVYSIFIEISNPKEKKKRKGNLQVNGKCDTFIKCTTFIEAQFYFETLERQDIFLCNLSLNMNTNILNICNIIKQRNHHT